MTLKWLASQLELQGVDSGYVQRFDWEMWILNSYLMMEDLQCDTVGESTKKTKSLVLYLLQEYLWVVNAEYVRSLEEQLAVLRRDLEQCGRKAN